MAKLIGTAGHVDHGKTTLIQALTGIDADRLPEEKRRGMTIDVGFAYIDMPKIGRVSIVDVPGHEKFLTNMLVGALGIDVALLCVAADEGVKPQTREHLDILQLLPVDDMVVALTRADLADDETRELARMEVEELLSRTRFSGSPIIAVSATTGEGLGALRMALSKSLSSEDADREENAGSDPWYLPIDRAFAVKGHGCVVTGTLAQGEVALGDAGVIEPGHREVRIRGIHSHGEPLKAGEAGRRIALNLSGVRLEEVHRGQSIGAPGALFETSILDAAMRWLRTPKHGSRIRLSIGAEEAIGKIFMFDLEPDTAQIRLEAPVACAKGQPLILRRYSPPDLLGGGTVTVPLARPRRKGEAPEVPHFQEGDRSSILRAINDDANGVLTDEICRRLGKTPQQLGDVFETLRAEGAIRSFAGLWFSAEAFEQAKARFLEALARLHAKNPTLSAVPREKVLREAQLRWNGKPLDRIISALGSEGAIRAEGTNVRAEGFKVSLTERQRALLNRVLEALRIAGVNVPSPLDIARSLGVPVQAIEEILKLGIQAGEIVRVGDGLFYPSEGVTEIKTKIKQIAGKAGFTASDFRDAVGSSRKYVIPLLEYLDSQRFTLRVGDKRVVRNGEKPDQEAGPLNP